MCTSLGLSDGRLLLMEVSRALAPATSSFIQSLIVGAAERLGKRLMPQIKKVEDELTALQDNTSPSAAGTIAGHPETTRDLPPAHASAAPSASASLSTAVAQSSSVPSSASAIPTAVQLPLHSNRVQLITPSSSSTGLSREEMDSTESSLNISAEPVALEVVENCDEWVVFDIAFFLFLICKEKKKAAFQYTIRRL